jgi:hypothetical protein
MKRGRGKNGRDDRSSNIEIRMAVGPQWFFFSPFEMASTSLLMKAWVEPGKKGVKET